MTQNSTAQDLLPAGSRVFVAGHRGLVGSAIDRALRAEGFETITRPHSALDLADAHATLEFLRVTRPDVVVLAAARVGGIQANATRPVDFLEENLRIQLSVISAAHETGVRRFLFLGSSCIYPRMAPQPIPEGALLTGPLEETNRAYAIAKIAGITQVQAYRSQYGSSYISAMPTNVYGPGDNFDLESSHVLPALVRRIHEAKELSAPEVVLWGTGTPRREFLHADDVASACVALLHRYDAPGPVNIGCGEDLSIADLAHCVADVVGYRGSIRFDATHPDGTPRKLLDVGLLRSLGWAPTISLEDGIARTYDWWLRYGRTEAA